jgi:hypothetical protein
MPNSTSNINETFQTYSVKYSTESRNKIYLKYNLYFVWHSCITAAEQQKATGADSESFLRGCGTV